MIANSGLSGKRILHPSLWTKVHVDPLPYEELRQVGAELFPSLPVLVRETSLRVLRKLDQSGRGEHMVRLEDGTMSRAELGGNAAQIREDPSTLSRQAWSASVRDYVKLLARILSTVHFDPGVTYVTEAQRTICLAETVDIFSASTPNLDQRIEFITKIAAPLWEVPADLAHSYALKRCPPVKVTEGYIEVGRCRLYSPFKCESTERKVSSNAGNPFAETHYALRLMETIGVCASLNEPTLLVGGKEIYVRRLAGGTVLNPNASSLSLIHRNWMRKDNDRTATCTVIGL